MDKDCNLNSLLSILNSSVQELYEKDKDLLLRDETPLEGMERSCAFRIGHYLCNNLIQDEALAGYHVDMEYNKKGDQPKIIKDRRRKDRRRRPDLIVHRRSVDDDNLLVVEFKHGLGHDTSNDKDKLKGFTCESGEYKYKLGVLVELNISEKKSELDISKIRYTYFYRGEEVTEEEWSKYAELVSSQPNG